MLLNYPQNRSLNGVFTVIPPNPWLCPAGLKHCRAVPLHCLYVKFPDSIMLQVPARLGQSEFQKKLKCIEIEQLIHIHWDMFLETLYQHHCILCLLFQTWAVFVHKESKIVTYVFTLLEIGTWHHSDFLKWWKCFQILNWSYSNACTMLVLYILYFHSFSENCDF